MHFLNLKSWQNICDVSAKREAPRPLVNLDIISEN